MTKFGVCATMWPMGLISLDKFAVHNQHWVGPEQFINYDPQLRRLRDIPFVYRSAILQAFPYYTPGIYTIGGGRQVGKTTFLKQSILRLLDDGRVPKQNILFLTGELLTSGEELLRILTSFISEDGDFIVFVDEVNYIPAWDRFVKFLADAGKLERCALILTGSDMVVVKDAMKRFPGRRGRAEKTNFHYYPLSFAEVVALKKAVPTADIEEIAATPYEKLGRSDVIKRNIGIMYQELKNFVITGGFLTAINDLAKEGKINTQTLTTYWEWILGDVLKRGKTENYLREILSGIIKRYNTQITWNSLSKDLSIDHHKTVSDYCDMLSQMEAVYIQPALLEHKLAAAPKKARKVYFFDPFIYHAIHTAINDTGNPWENYLGPLFEGSDGAFSPHIEAAVVTHFQRRYKTYYIKNHGEIDLAYVDGKKFYPVEIKWTSQLRQKELLYISEYPQGIIAAKINEISKIGVNWVVPIPVLLMQCTTRNPLS